MAFFRRETFITVPSSQLPEMEEEERTPPCRLDPCPGEDEFTESGLSSPVKQTAELFVVFTRSYFVQAAVVLTHIKGVSQTQNK